MVWKVITYLRDSLFFGAYDAADIVANALVANALALQEVFGDHLLDFFFSICSESVSLDIELYDTIVG